MPSQKTKRTVIDNLKMSIAERQQLINRYIYEFVIKSVADEICGKQKQIDNNTLSYDVPIVKHISLN